MVDTRIGTELRGALGVVAELALQLTEATLRRNELELQFNIEVNDAKPIPTTIPERLHPFIELDNGRFYGKGDYQLSLDADFIESFVPVECDKVDIEFHNQEDVSCMSRNALNRIAVYECRLVSV